MDAPICKADQCSEARVNDSLCGYHTYKLQPIYLRYKKIESDMPAFCDVSDSIPDLVRLYGLYAKVCRLRERYRNSLKPEHQDPGHDQAIASRREEMLRINERLLTLTQFAPVEEKPVPEHHDDSDDETPLTAEDVIQEEFNIVQESRRKYKPNDPDRLLCGTAILNYIQLKVDKMNRAMALMAENAITEARVRASLPPESRLLSVMPQLMVYLKTEKCIMTHVFAANSISESAIIACRDQKDVSHSLGGERRGPSMLICCVKKQIEVLLKTEIFVFSVRCMLGLYASKTVKQKSMFYDVKRKPPYLEFTYRAIGFKCSGLIMEPMLIPMHLFEHECTPDSGTLTCRACHNEIEQKLNYKTLPGHTADLPPAPREHTNTGFSIQYLPGDHDDEARFTRLVKRAPR